MTRPYLRYSIAQLEEMFPGVKSDHGILKALEEELKNRQVPRAQALLQEVREMLATAKQDSSEKSQTELFSASANREPLSAVARKRTVAFDPKKPGGWDFPTGTRETEARQTPVISKQDGASEFEIPQFAPGARATVSKNVLPTETKKVHAEETALMPLDTAYKLLKCGPTTAWEEVERVRRQLVAQSHPEKLASLTPEQKAQAQAEVKRVNAAYKALLAVRLQS